jgi:hypothetical protein
MIDFLFQIIKNHGMKLIYSDIHIANPLLDAYTIPDTKQIIVDITLPHRPRQHKCILAEEVGHVLYPPMDGSALHHVAEYWDYDCYQRSNISYRHVKSERAALLWATSFLISDTEFWEFASQGPHEWWEWLERFDVEDWFLKRKVGFMRTKKSFKWREVVKRTTIAGGSGV